LEVVAVGCGVFINYRGDDSEFCAEFVFEELSARFGEDRVFLDSRSIPIGHDFVDALLRRLRACNVLLVIIGPRWLSQVDADGARRIDDANDWVRREVAEALRLGLNVVPVLTDGARIPTEVDLPDNVAAMCRRQYAVVRRRHAREDVQGLVVKLAQLDPDLARSAESVSEARETHETHETHIPRQLPRAPTQFVGRERELATLGELTDMASSNSSAVVVSAIAGTAGVGKTALVLQWGCQAQDRFPDGQLYVNMRGYDSEQPVQPAEALAAFLHALGVSGPQIPLGLDERAGMYRSLLATRRVLVVVDNVSCAEQVRPLLPGESPSCVLVTSRDSLASLVVREGAQRLDLDLLPKPDAISLLNELLGARARHETSAVATLADQCARLPLALRVAAELAAAQTGSTIAQLVEELVNEHRRLELLDAGHDSRTAVRSVFSWSFRHLPLTEARCFRLLGLHPGPDFDKYAAAALTQTSAEAAQSALDVLARAHLVQRARSGRYEFHDLLRVYAQHLVRSSESDDEQQSALRRLFAYYIASAGQAVNILDPAAAPRRPPPPTHQVPSPAITSAAVAQRWLDSEGPSLAASSAHMASHGWQRYCTQLAIALFPYFNLGGYHVDALAIQSQGLNCARTLEDHDIESAMLTNLGILTLRVGRPRLAAEHLKQAAITAEIAGNAYEESRALTNLANSYALQGQLDTAVEYHHRALTIARIAGDRPREARALSNLSMVLCQQGLYQRAATCSQQAIDMAIETGDRMCEVLARSNRATVSTRLGRHEEAREDLEHVLALARESGTRVCEADALIGLATILLRKGRHLDALDLLQQARTLTVDIGDLAGEGNVEVTLGRLLVKTRQHSDAIFHYRRAVDLLHKANDSCGHAKALNRLGEVLFASGQAAESKERHTEALTLAIATGDRYEQARAHSGLSRTQGDNEDR
jgi:tetratricopeptide (TPR) repeat protein